MMQVWYHLSLFNRFNDLPADAADVETEWEAFKDQTKEVAETVLGRQQKQRQHKPGLSESTLSMIHRKQEAFTAWQQRRQQVQCKQQQLDTAQQEASLKGLARSSSIVYSSLMLRLLLLRNVQSGTTTYSAELWSPG